MNKKGFTLIEMLAVFVIMGIVTVLITPVIYDILKESKETVFDNQINRILDATYDYTLKNPSFLPEVEETNFITLAKLKQNGFIDYNIINSNNIKMFEDNLVISIKNVGSNYKNEFNNSMIKGKYLYKVEMELMDSDEFKNNKPSITFDKYSELPKVLEINVGDEYLPLQYTAKSFLNEDLTEQVVSIISIDSKIIDKIDTTKEGIYNINYSVVDEQGYSTLESVNVVIKDSSKPILIIPENETISLDVSTYDLMSGVSCTDNSGICNIKINGNINFGVIGKYIIEYSAYDPTGNTTYIKRVITIE